MSIADGNPCAAELFAFIIHSFEAGNYATRLAAANEKYKHRSTKCNLLLNLRENAYTCVRGTQTYKCTVPAAQKVIMGALINN